VSTQAYEDLDDPRLKALNDRPACFRCGHVIATADHGCTFMPDDGLPLHCHYDCMNGVKWFVLTADYHRAVTGIVTGGPSKRLGAFGDS